MTNTKIKSFTDLRAWQEAHGLAIDVYKATEAFPKKEMFGLTSQIRRSAVSVPSNIAEGFARRSAKEKKQFYATALGSLAELQSQLLLARDVGYLEKERFSGIAEQSLQSRKLLQGLAKSTTSYAQ